MIRITGYKGSAAPSIKVLRKHLPYTISEAKRLLDSAPSDLPHTGTAFEHSPYREKELRQELEGAGCVLEDTCASCLGNKAENCASCSYWPYTHTSFYPPADFKGPIAGSMYAFTTMCGFGREDNTPRVHSGLSEEEREAITSKVTCPTCRQALINWGYLEKA